MKSIVFKIDEQLFKNIHIRAARCEKSVQDYMCDLIKTDLTQNTDPDQAIEALLKVIEDVQNTLRQADGLLENATKQIRGKRAELAEAEFPKEVLPYLDYPEIGAKYCASHSGVYTENGCVMRQEVAHEQGSEPEQTQGPEMYGMGL